MIFCFSCLCWMHMLQQGLRISEMTSQVQTRMKVFLYVNKLTSFVCVNKTLGLGLDSFHIPQSVIKIMITFNTDSFIFLGDIFCTHQSFTNCQSMFFSCELINFTNFLRYFFLLFILNMVKIYLLSNYLYLILNIRKLIRGYR